MTLSFSTQVKGQPTYFPEKIIIGMPLDDCIRDYIFSTYYREEWFKNLAPVRSKIHSIRRDKNNLWHSGRDIHFVINNRSKNRLQFAPVLPCVCTQKIIIEYSAFFPPLVAVDGRKLNRWEIKELAINDGFDSVEDFFSWFNLDYEGKIIHWTDFKY